MSLSFRLKDMDMELPFWVLMNAVGVYWESEWPDFGCGSLVVAESPDLLVGFYSLAYAYATLDPQGVLQAEYQCLDRPQCLLRERPHVWYVVW